MPTSNDVVIALLQTLQESVDGQHERTNKRLEDGFRDLNRKLDAHEKEDRATARIVDRIVTERDGEAKARGAAEREATKRASLTASVVGGALVVSGWIVQHFWKG